MGDRQRRIIEALQLGSWSLVALIRHLGGPRELVQAALQRLERAGRVVITGKHGKDCRGATVELVPEPVVRPSPVRRAGTVRFPAGPSSAHPPG
jgi:hypothetical protein